MTSPSGLEIRSLTAGYNGLPIVTDIDLTVKFGELVIVVGPNGCGKSTMLRAVAGLAAVYRGTIKFNSSDLVGTPPWLSTRQGVVYARQTGSYFPDFSVRANLLSSVKFGRRSKEGEIAPILDALPILGEKLDVAAGNLSGGERQVLSFARTVLMKPRLLLLDEPIAGLASTTARAVLDLLEAMRLNSDVTTLVAEHETSILKYSHRNLIRMDSGKIATSFHNV